MPRGRKASTEPKKTTKTTPKPTEKTSRSVGVPKKSSTRPKQHQNPINQEEISAPLVNFDVNNIKTYQELKEALVAKIPQITLGDNIIAPENILITADVKIDFNGFSIISEETVVAARVLDIRSGTVVLTGRGKIFAMGPRSMAIRAFGAISSGIPDYTNVTIGKDISLYAPDAYGIIISPNLGVAYGVKVDFAGQIMAQSGICIAAGVQGEAKNAPQIILQKTAHIIADETQGAALEASGYGDWQITGAWLQGAVGAELRTGNLTFSKTKIIAHSGEVFRINDYSEPNLSVTVDGGTYVSQQAAILAGFPNPIKQFTLKKCELYSNLDDPIPPELESYLAIEKCEFESDVEGYLESMDMLQAAEPSDQEFAENLESSSEELPENPASPDEPSLEIPESTSKNPEASDENLIKNSNSDINHSQDQAIVGDEIFLTEADLLSNLENSDTASETSQAGSQNRAPASRNSKTTNQKTKATSKKSSRSKSAKTTAAPKVSTSDIDAAIMAAFDEVSDDDFVDELFDFADDFEPADFRIDSKTSRFLKNPFRKGTKKSATKRSSASKSPISTPEVIDEPSRDTSRSVAAQKSTLQAPEEAKSQHLSPAPTLTSLAPKASRTTTTSSSQSTKTTSTPTSVTSALTQSTPKTTTSTSTIASDSTSTSKPRKTKKSPRTTKQPQMELLPLELPFADRLSEVPELSDADTDEQEIMLGLGANADHASAQILTQPPLPIDIGELEAARMALAEAIGEIRRLRAEDYEAGFLDLEAALNYAEQVLTRPVVDLATIRDAAASLLQAFDGLEERDEFALSDAELDDLFYHGAVLEEMVHPQSNTPKFPHSKTSKLNANSESAVVQAEITKIASGARLPQTARDPLIPEPDFTILSDILSTISTLDLQKYASSSRESLLAELDQAQAVLTDLQATQAQIDLVASNLLAQLSRLEPKIAERRFRAAASVSTPATSAPAPVIKRILPAAMIDELAPTITWSSGVTMIDELTPFVTDATTREKMLRAVQPHCRALLGVIKRPFQKLGRSVKAGWSAGLNAYRETLHANKS